jgi:hypothetical protein
MSSCLNCGGLIMKPGVAYGYAGPVCHCPIHPSRMYQNPSDNPLPPAPRDFYPQDSRVFGKPDADTFRPRPPLLPPLLST